MEDEMLTKGTMAKNVHERYTWVVSWISWYHSYMVENEQQI